MFMKNLTLLMLVLFMAIACTKQSIDVDDIEPIIAFGDGGDDDYPVTPPDGYGRVVVYFNQEAADSFATFSSPDTLNFLANDVLVGVRHIFQYDSTATCANAGNGVVITTFFNLWHPDPIEIVVIDNDHDTVWKVVQQPMVDSCIIVELGMEGFYLQ